MYKQLNIRTLEHLAHRLGVPLTLIESVLASKATHYHSKPKVTQPGKEPRPIVLISETAKEILKKINALLLDELGHPSYMHGGMKKRTILTNARAHVGADFLLKLDIRKFFPSITPTMVEQALMKHAGLTMDVAQMVTGLATFENKLITGSPASTVIASLVIRSGTERIHGLIKQHGGNFSVFVDDVTISGGRHLSKLQEKCVKWLEETGVKVHPGKMKRTSGDRADKVVTGVDVAAGIDAPRKFRREVQELCNRLASQYPPGTTPTIAEQQGLRGKLNHLRLLNPGMAKVYFKRYGYLLAAPT